MRPRWQSTCQAAEPPEDDRLGGYVCPKLGQQSQKHSKLLVIIASGVLILSAWVFRAHYTPFMVTAAVIAGLPVVRLAWLGLMARQFTIPLLVSASPLPAEVD